MTEMPDFEGMYPKEMRRAWAVFMADHDLTGPLHIAAEYVRLSIEELILNLNRDAEPNSRRNLDQKIATFRQMWAERRG